jgi:C4-dicarboxylate-specific signal transduction histidine kinase
MTARHEAVPLAQRLALNAEPAGAPARSTAEAQAQLAQAQRLVASDPAAAVLLAEQTLVCANNGGDPPALLSLLIRASGIARSAGRPDRAFMFCMEALPALNRNNDPMAPVQLPLIQGACFYDVGEFDGAMEQFSLALERAKEMPEAPQQLMSCHEHLAKACAKAGQLAQALEHIRLAASCLSGERIDISVQRRLLQQQAQWQSQIAEQLAQEGRHAEAMQAWLLASGIAAHAHLPPNEYASIQDVEAMCTATDIHLSMGHQEQARACLLQLLQRTRHSPAAQVKGLRWLQLAKFRQSQERLLSAISSARRAARYLKTVHDQGAQVQLLVARWMEDTGDFQGAYEALGLANIIETQQQRQAIAIRAELLSLDLDAERQARQTAKRTQYATRLSNIGNMVASVNHELNQPLASIKMLAESSIEVLHAGLHQEAQANIQTIYKLSERLIMLTSQLAAFPAQVPTELSAVDVGHAVDEALSVLAARLKQTPCEVVRRLPRVSVKAVEDQLVRVLVNLLNNALDAMQDQSIRRIEISGSAEEGPLFRLYVADAGPGLPDSTLKNVFQPFFSTKAPGLGLGLGLSLSRDAMRAMQGELTATNRPQGGAVFCVALHTMG